MLPVDHADPWRSASPLHPGLIFRYTQGQIGRSFRQYLLGGSVRKSVTIRTSACSPVVAPLLFSLRFWIIDLPLLLRWPDDHWRVANQSRAGYQPREPIFHLFDAWHVLCGDAKRRALSFIRQDPGKRHNSVHNVNINRIPQAPTSALADETATARGWRHLPWAPAQMSFLRSLMRGRDLPV